MKQEKFYTIAVEMRNSGCGSYDPSGRPVNSVNLSSYGNFKTKDEATEFAKQEIAEKKYMNCYILEAVSFIQKQQPPMEVVSL